MSAKHTPEPWSLFAEHGEIVITSNDRPYVAGFCAGGFAGAMEANADRIVACVNACAEIEDPAELRRQRDELLEALENLLNDETWAAEEAARKAIANAKKGTQ